MIPVQVAIDIVLSEVGRLPSETVGLADAVGRILEQDVIADTDLPPFDRSQMDGFAVIAADIENAPVTLAIVGESAAGHGWHFELSSDQAVRIMTGAPVPAGANAVQKVELTEQSGLPDGQIRMLEPVKVGANIVRRGAEVKSGETIFSSGELITPQMIAVLAAFGYASVTVAKSPRVGILATGSEIVPVDQKPGLDQIRNSNAPMLEALAARCGAIARSLPLAEDDIEELKASIADGLAESDILIITGGVSVGKYDLTKPALLQLGADIKFEKVSLKPGKPAVFATLGDKLIFGLPGNPVSAAVTFELFVRPAIMGLSGASNRHLRAGHAVLSDAAKAAKGRDTYLPATLDTDRSGRLIVTPLRWQGSSDFIGFARAEALIRIDAGQRLESGDAAAILFL